MTVREYNEGFLPLIDNAFDFVSNLDNALLKTDDLENTLYQLGLIHWSDTCKETLIKALECYKESVVISQ